jgi:hypothetical protein
MLPTTVLLVGLVHLGFVLPGAFCGFFATGAAFSGSITAAAASAFARVHAMGIVCPDFAH